MKSDVLKPTGKAILLGNEAIVRGALEAGARFAAAYPGTPSSEIGMTFAEIAEEVGAYFEYSTNEKVAAEVAAGAAFSGIKSLVCFKHFGFNVASDSIYPLAYHGIKAGLVIIVADDPGCHSSGQSEQDSRYLARVGHMPLLEPADPQECKDFTKLAFSISEELSIPVIIRTTTRVAHASAIVTLGSIPQVNKQGMFKKGDVYRNMPPEIINVHVELNDKLQKLSADNRINFVKSGKGKLGIITNGVSYHYACEAMKELKLDIPILKLGLTWPFPETAVKNFIKNLDQVFVIEELEPVMEKDIQAIAKDANPKLKIMGKTHVPYFCELRQEIILEALVKITKKEYAAPKGISLDIPKRLPTFCPGCPHRATFWSVKQAVPKGTVFGGDIGCYILGIFPPTEMQDFIIAMGAAEGISHGIAKSTAQKPIAFIGDSTFFHAGMPGIVNTVFNKSNVMTVCLDNRWTAMTGQQQNPGTGMTAMGDKTKALKIEEIGKAFELDNVTVANAYNIKDTIDKAKDLYSKPGNSLLVSKGECRLQFMRRARKEGIKVPVFEIDPEKCTKCGICLEKFGCPAIQRKEDGTYFIDKAACWGCSACAQICPAKAISPAKLKK